VRGRSAQVAVAVAVASAPLGGKGIRSASSTDRKRKYSRSPSKKRAAIQNNAAKDKDEVVQPSSSSLTSLNTRPAPQHTTTMVEHCLLAMTSVALAYFLAAYQVHEKSILIAAVPFAALHLRLPLLSIWLSAASTWSMWPLLFKDGLLLPATALVAGYVYAGWPEKDWVGEGEALLPALRRLGLKTSADQVQRWLRKSVVISAAICGLLSAAAYLLPPPKNLPDLHPYLSAVVCAGGFLILLCLCVAIQYGWVREMQMEGEEEVVEEGQGARKGS
jgi:hypothetical protein